MITVKLRLLLVPLALLTETLYWPGVAWRGTTKLKLVPLLELTWVILAVPNSTVLAADTALAADVKFVPVTFTLVPSGPEDGLSVERVGARDPTPN